MKIRCFPAVAVGVVCALSTACGTTHPTPPNSSTPVLPPASSAPPVAPGPSAPNANPAMSATASSPAPPPFVFDSPEIAAKKFDPGIQSWIAAHSDQAKEVEVEFSVAPGPADLAGLGMEWDGKTAWGMTNSQVVESLGRFPQVRAARFSQRPMRPRPAPRPGQKFDGSLQLALLDPSVNTFLVIVSFQEPPKNPPAYVGMTSQRMGSGHLTRAQLSELDRRTDVVSISLMPTMYPTATGEAR